ncbi:hypothetical protein HDU98_001242 [Podochytrium sp. JEL0797]|nr:hypothetical protein HDU98_001242 [Podochytrium sp. JEL0797]
MSTPANPTSTQAREDRIKELEAILGNSSSNSNTGSSHNPANPPSAAAKPPPAALTNQPSSISVASSSKQHTSLSRQLSQLGRDLDASAASGTGGSVESLADRPSVLGGGGGSAGKGKHSGSVSSKPPAPPHTSSSQPDFRLQKSSSAVGWVPLVSRDFKGKPKNAIPATDKALLAILEEERSKYTALEQTYHALLTEVKALQTAHIHEIKAADKRADTTVQSAHKQLLEKSEQQQATAQELKRMQARFDQVCASREAEVERFEFQHTRVSGMVKEAERKCGVLERLVEELKGVKRELGERLGKREAEMKKLIGMYKERENECVLEREARMKLELQILKLDQTVEQRDTDIRILREQLKVKSGMAEEGVKFKEAHADACREVEQLVQREKMYLQEIETASQREKQLFSKLDELNASYQKAMADYDRTNATCSSKTKELEMLKQSETKLKSELNSTYQTSRAQNEEISELEKQARQLHNERTALQQDLADLRAFTVDVNSQLKQKSDEINSLRELELQMRRDNQALKQDLFASQDDYASLQSQLLDVAKRLDLEVQAKSDLKQDTKEKITSLTEKMYDLQRGLNTTQAQLEGSQQTEKLLRANIQQKEITLNDQHRHLQDMEKTIIDLREVVNKDEMVIETLKAKKKEDMMLVQEKFLAARQVMDQDVNTLKQQLNAKGNQATALSEQTNQMKFEISELTAEKFKLEMKVAELAANDSNQSRNVVALQQQLRIRDQELNVTSIKHQSLMEHVRMLEEELQSHRNQNLRKDGEIQRIQNNVTEMNRKLREQVGVFLERADMEATSSVPVSPYIPRQSIVRQNTFPSRVTPTRDLLVSSKLPSQKSITGMDDLDADLQQFLQFRGEGSFHGGQFLSKPALPSPDSLLQNNNQ